MKKTTISKKAKKFGQAGGYALFEKVGPEGMSKLAKRRWKKERANKKSNLKGKK